jgi:hypothetical protein
MPDCFLRRHLRISASLVASACSAEQAIPPLRGRNRGKHQLDLCPWSGTWRWCLDPARLNPPHRVGADLIVLFSPGEKAGQGRLHASAAGRLEVTVLRQEGAEDSIGTLGMDASYLTHGTPSWNRPDLTGLPFLRAG